MSEPQEVARFYAVSDATGARHLVIEYEDGYTFENLSTRRRKRYGTTREWTLSDGSGVNCIDSEKYQIVETGEIIRKV